MNINPKLTVLILAFLAIPLSVHGQEKPIPDIHFEETEHDFGTVGQMEKHSHTFEFENKGTADLEIKKVKTSCGCTAALVAEKVIPPGGAGKIKATFDIGHRKYKQTKTIWVHSNDPDEPRSTLKIKAYVEPEFVVKPRRLDFGDVRKGKKKSITVKLIPARDKELKLLKVETSAKYLKAQFKKEKTKEGPSYKIKFTLLPKTPIGPVEETITLYTSNKKLPTYKLYASGRVWKNIRYSPVELYLSFLQPGEQGVEKIMVEAIGKKKFEITKVESVPALLDIEIDELEPGKRYSISLSLLNTQELKEGRHEVSLLIHTNLPGDEALLKIPVHAFLYKPRPAKKK